MMHASPPHLDARKDVLTPADAYDAASSRYDEWKWQTFWRSTEAPFVLNTIGKHTDAERDSLLDVGCGTGFYLKELQPYFRSSVGIDVSQGMLSIARARVPLSEFIHADSAEFRSNTRFDVVLCTRVLSHLEDYRISLRMMMEMLKPKGLLLISNVDASHPYELTKLPTADGSVMAATFKHRQSSINQYLKLAGMQLVSDAVFCDDSSSPVTNLSTARAKLGWASAFQFI